MAELHLLSPAGFRASGVYAGIRSKAAPDVAMLVANEPATAAAVFTTNKVFAAPVKLGRKHVKSGKLRGVIVNAGNANACTGKQGERDAARMCALAASSVNARANQFLPCSTGIIGHYLPMEKLERGIIEAGQYLGNSMEHALTFADAILTTDLKRKTAAVEFMIGRTRVRLAGVCKGSGMIGPRMALPGGKPQATLLAFLTTDVDIAPSLLRRTLQESTDSSFNCVTIDDHTSTNDTAAILASSASGVRVTSGRAASSFRQALDEVCQSLAQQIAADGEGATKVVTVQVKRAATQSAARAIAHAIADSPLVKTAIHGNDPNWGRIVSAAGYAGVPFDPDRAVLWLQRTMVFKRGRPIAFDASATSDRLKSKEVLVELDCGAGKGEATCWTCDLSHDYIRINAEYST